MILILSNSEDCHIVGVTEELKRRGEEYRLFDPGPFPYSCRCVVDCSEGEPHARIDAEGTSLDLDRIRAVWLRRPGEFQLSARLKAEELKWLRTECNHFFDAMWANLNAFWVSEPAQIRRASLKLLQLRKAIELGLRVPRFVVTNDVSQAKSFIASCPGGVVVKVLALPTIFSPDRVATLYTHLITKNDLSQIDSVSLGPTYLQEYVPKSMDIRVTVIGRSLFAVGIDAAGVESGRVDFRRAEVFELPHHPIKLPRRVEKACLDLVEWLGLQFGAIDLLLTGEGEYVFLEINPNGQWLWIEWMTGLPLTKAICDLLIAGNRGETVKPRRQRNRSRRDEEIAPLPAAG